MKMRVREKLLGSGVVFIKRCLARWGDLARLAEVPFSPLLLRFSVSGLAALCLAGCGGLARSANSNEVFPTGSEVRVVVALSHGLSTDDTPVRTDLYPYLGGNSYITTGPPLSFVFPKYFYASEENMEGGPQSMVRLRIDRQTMQPIGRLLKNMPEWPHGDIAQAYNHYFGRRDLNVDIASNAHGPAMDERERSLIPVYQLGPVAARVCGFELRPGRNPYFDGNPRTTIADVDLPPGTYAGRALASNSLSRVVSCTQDSPICLCVVRTGKSHC